MNKLFGVNLAGAEFDNNNPAQTVPGVNNKDYTYPTLLAEHQYYVNKGLPLFRVPLRWERIQRSLGGELDLAELASIKTVLDTAHQAGAKVLLDLHNYGQYQTGVANNQPVLQPVTLGNKQNLVDVWTKLVTQFKDHPAIFGYELMNEPHDLPDGESGWVFICQAVATAIEAIDPIHYIVIPGYDWQSADRWQQSNPELLITGKNILYAAHCYFDGDASGQYWWGDVTDANASGRVQHFIDWIKTHTVQGIITEYGVPFGTGAANPKKTEWYPILENFLKLLSDTPEILGGTAWAGGPWWGDYNLTIEPTNTFTTDRESMAIYAKFPSTPATTPPLPTPTPPVTSPPTPPVPTLPGNTVSTPPAGNPGNTTPTPPQTATLDVGLLNTLIADAEALLKKLKTLLGIN